MSNAKAEGFEVGLKAQAMASPQRVEAVIEDEERFWKLVGDLASFEKVARAAAAHDKQYQQASEGLILAISFISHVRSTNKKLKRESAGN